ncbi:hypothetical protein NSERUTF1_5396 [Nocardia seriolae]|nr:hypothetical protein NSERUTF1_5396 [Nocardia seriolae]
MRIDNQSILERARDDSGPWEFLMKIDKPLRSHAAMKPQSGTGPPRDH